MARPKLTASQKLKWISAAVYSISDEPGGLTPDQALSVIASFFSEDPQQRILPEHLPTFLNVISAPRRRPKHRRGP